MTTPTTTPEMQDMIRIKGAMRELDISRTTLYQWIKDHGWTMYKAGNLTYLDRREIMTLFAQGE